LCHKLKILILLISCCIVSIPGLAQSSSNSTEHSRLVIYEWFGGDSNADGQVMALDSTVSYYFTRHFSARAGLPIYFDRVPVTATSSMGSAGSASSSTFSSGVGDIFLSLRAGWKGSLVNYATSLTGTAPTGDSSKGFSTGHFTFDWDNRFDRTFVRITPFFDLGLANSVTDTPYFFRPFATLGPLAHFEAGAGLRLAKFLSITASAYDIAPWGTQTVISRVVTAAPQASVSQASAQQGRSGVAHPGRPFENTHQTSGTSSLTRDDGFTAGAVISPNSYLDLQAGYTRSAQYALNSISFGIGVNVTSLLGKTLRP
jgi:hypothetical protein